MNNEKLYPRIGSMANFFEEVASGMKKVLKNHIWEILIY
jgi:hypothetical protein